MVQQRYFKEDPFHGTPKRQQRSAYHIKTALRVLQHPYYVEGSHPTIINKEIFMQVQEEIARCEMLKDSLGRRKCFSAAHAFSQITFCSECGAEYSQLHWNNRGKKSVVWRCGTRLNNHTKCNVRTIKEYDLQ